MRFLCIGDPDTVRGFRLAGVESVVVLDVHSASEAFAAAAAREDCGLIVLPHSVAEMIRAQVDRVRLEGVRPLVAEIDDFTGPLWPLEGRWRP